MSYRNKNKQKFDPKVGYSTAVITDPDEFYHTFKADKGVNFKEHPHPSLKDTTIIDITLAGRGFVEDSIYEEYPYYRNNIRRGNTLLKIGKEVYWLRKGLKKFFDIGLEYLSGNLKGNHSFYATFREIENVLNFRDFVDEKDKPVCHVWKLLKANGENCQISYNKELKMWSISSKNVTILVRDYKQINNYKDQRHQFAVLIARCFLKLIESNNYSAAELDQLTDYLSTHTLVGEYCGNPECQHIVKYQCQTILFYAIVNNRSRDPCIPPPEANEFFRKFNLPTTNDLGKSLVGKYSTFSELCQALKELFHQVASGKLHEDEEGCVVYLGLECTEGFYKQATQKKMQERFDIPEKCDKVNLKVSSLGKLKTLEYRLLRKLRQKLKHFTAHPQKYADVEKLKKDQRHTFNKFVNESKDLMKATQLKTPFQFYKLLALVSLNYIADNIKNPAAFDLLKSAYIDFLSIIMYSIENNITPTFEMMTDSDLILKLRKTPWTEYNTNVGEIFEKEMDKFYPSYKKIMEAKEIDKEGSSSHDDADADKEGD